VGIFKIQIVVRHIFNHESTETDIIFLLDVKYMHSFYIISVSVYI
jgi:hypothetical protein